MHTAKNANAAWEVWQSCLHANKDPGVRDWLAGYGGISNFHEVRALPSKTVPRWKWLTDRKPAGTTWYSEGYRVVFPLWELDGSFAGILARRVRSQAPLCLTSEYGYHGKWFLADVYARSDIAQHGRASGDSYVANITFLPTDYLRLLGQCARVVVMTLADAWTKDMIARFGRNVHFKLHDNYERMTREKTVSLIKSFEDAFNSIKRGTMSMEIVPPNGQSKLRDERQNVLNFVPPPDLLDDDPPAIFDEPDLGDDPPPPALAKLTPTQKPQAVSAQPLRPAISRSLRKRKGRQLADGTRDGARDVIQQNIYLPPELKQEMEAFRAARGEQISEFFCAAATARLAQERGLEQSPPPPPPPAHTDIPTLVTELLRASTESDDEARARMDRLRYSPRSRFQFTTNVGERLDRYIAERQVPKSQGRDAWLALNDLLDKVLPP
jgi:hypothetical protein